MVSAKKLFLTFAVLLFPLTEAGAQIDSLYESIDSTTVIARRKEGLSAVSGNSVVIEMQRLHTLPMLLGSADPLGFAHYLPAMSARSELDSGIHIQGNDQAHNLISAGGVPIYGVSHLLGIFSVFNSTHYSKMRFQTLAPGVNRLGGVIDMEPRADIPAKVGGDLSAGLLSAQGTLRIPLGKKAGLTVSARRSYINLLYGQFLKVEDVPVRYGFTDVNLTAFWAPGDNDKLWFDAYWGNDSMSGLTPMYDLDASWNWGNAMAAIHWKHNFSEGGTLHQKAYITGYQTKLDGIWTDMHATLPSRIVTGAYRADWSHGRWQAAFESALHVARPQDPKVEGGYAITFQPQPRQTGWENTLCGRYSLPMGEYLSLDMGLKGSLYLSPEGKIFAGADPDLALKADLHRGGQLELRVGLQHQYLFQTGMTDIGFPMEFWFLAGELSPPQLSFGESLSYSLDFLDGAYTLQAELYHRHLWNQVEYKGHLLDIINGSYSLEKAILKGRGRAFGVNISLHKTAGAFTGWISYAWGRSLRSFDNPDYPGEYPASHERIHEADAVLSWKVGRWSFGATVVAASGTPYTAPEHLYLMGQQLVAQYGPHNGRRMAPYFRVDLSVNFFFNRGPRLENGINLSLYNATGSNNELYYRLYYKNKDTEKTFSYGPVVMSLRFLPSICYFHRF